MPLPLKKLLTESDVQENRRLFEAVQGYTLVSHGRKHVWLVLLRFAPEPETAQPELGFANVLREYGDKATSAYELYTSYKKNQDNKAKAEIPSYRSTEYQRKAEEVKAMKARTVFAVGLAPGACERLATGKPDSKAFNEGFARKFSPLLKQRDAIEKRRYDAVIVLAGNEIDELKACKDKITADLEGIAKVTCEEGYASKVDHFGYREGISQPVFFDFEGHRTTEWTSGWDPAVGLSCVLTSQPDRRSEDEYGSFMAYLKIAQDEEHFKDVVRQTAAKLVAAQPGIASREGTEAFRQAIDNKIPEVMGQLLGRMPDGKPLPAHGSTDENDFDYANVSPAQCPMHSHIRKVNPRTEHNRNKRILRRGVLYDYGKKDRGTLFQCFQSDLSTGFEYIFKEWVLNQDFPQDAAGIDSLLAAAHQAAPVEAATEGAAAVTSAARTRTLNVARADDAQIAVAVEDRPSSNDIPQAIPANDVTVNDVKRFVTVKEGEYFYFPSIPFFSRLAAGPSLHNRSRPTSREP